MPIKKRTNSLIAVFVFIFLLSGKHTLAYIDPGTGSYMLQIAIAFLVSALFTVKGFWKKIFTFLRKVFSNKKKNGDTAL